MSNLVWVGVLFGFLTGSAASAPARAAQEGARGACGDALAFQVLLDRHGFSSGQIDGRFGANTRRALAAFRDANKLRQTRTLDCDTWQALGGGDQSASTTQYTITEADAAGPFVENIPSTL